MVRAPATTMNIPNATSTLTSRFDFAGAGTGTEGGGGGNVCTEGTTNGCTSGAAASPDAAPHLAQNIPPFSEDPHETQNLAMNSPSAPALLGHIKNKLLVLHRETG